MEAGESVTGCTVHNVNDELDNLEITEGYWRHAGFWVNTKRGTRCARWRVHRATTERNLVETRRTRFERKWN